MHVSRKVTLRLWLIAPSSPDANLHCLGDGVSSHFRICWDSHLTVDCVVLHFSLTYVSITLFIWMFPISISLVHSWYICVLTVITDVLCRCCCALSCDCKSVSDPVAGVGDGVRGMRAGLAAGRGAYSMPSRSGTVFALRRAACHRRHGLFCARNTLHHVSHNTHYTHSNYPSHVHRHFYTNPLVINSVYL